MLKKTRAVVIAGAAALSFAGLTLAPTAADAQWHNYCSAGICTTHSNYTIGGKDPCAVVGKDSRTAFEWGCDTVGLQTR